MALPAAPRQDTPQTIATLIERGRALQANGRLDDAIDCFHAAIELDPLSAEPFFYLGHALDNAGFYDGAVLAYRHASKLAPDNTDVLNNLGNALAALANSAEAEPVFRQLLQIEPGHPAGLSNFANFLRDRGRTAEAMELYRRLLAVDPLHAVAHHSLAQETRYTADDPQLALMEKAYRLSAPDSRARAALGFGLFKAYESLGDDRHAFSHLAEANGIHRGSYRYSVDVEGAIFSQIKSFYSPEQASRLAGRGYRSSVPVFIVGMPRSGTSLAEQILATHPMVAGGGELGIMTDLVQQELINPRDYSLILEEQHFTSERLVRMGKSYVEAVLPLADGKPHVTDKMPLNFRWIGFIKAALPDAKIIHCRRAPLDTCFSIFASYFGSDGNRFAYDLDEIGTYYGHYTSLMRHWRSVFQDDIHEFILEDMIADQEGETRRLLEFLGLPFDPACLEFEKTERRIATVSNAQVRRRLNASSKGRTDRYYDQLSPLRSKLAAAEKAV